MWPATIANMDATNNCPDGSGMDIDILILNNTSTRNKLFTTMSIMSTSNEYIANLI